MPESRSVLYKNSKIFYEVYGTGKPVILIHGFAETGSVWLHQTTWLKKHFKIIVPDLPGCGKSFEFDIEASKVTIEDYAESVYAILQNEKVENCVMFGHSMGGYVALCFIEKYPEFLSGFGLVHSTAFADTEEKKQNRLRSIEIIENYGVHSFLKNATPSLFAQKFKDGHYDKISQLIEDGKQITTRSLQQAYYAMMNRPERTDIIRNKSLPVLFIAGNEDNAVALSDVLKQVHLPEISYFHILNQVGHMGIWEAANEVNKYLEEFVNDTA